MDITDYIPRDAPRRRKSPTRTRRERWRDYALYVLISLAFIVGVIFFGSKDGMEGPAIAWGIFSLVSAGAFGEIIFANQSCWRHARFWAKLCLLGVVQVIAFALFLLLVRPYMNRLLWMVAFAMDLCALRSARRWLRS